MCYNHRMDYKLNTLETAVSVSRIANVHFFEFPRGYEDTRNRHPFYELVFVAGGTVTVDSEDYRGELQKNECIVHRTGVSHRLLCREASETTVVIIGFEANEPLLDAFSYTPTRLEIGETKELSAIVREGRNVFSPPYDVPVYNMKKKKKQPFGSEQMLKLHLETFLIRLLRHKATRENREERGDYGFEVGEIVGYLDRNFLEKITIEELSFLFHTNRSTLCKAFKEETGRTVTAYINEKKTELAKKLLSDSDKTVDALAEEMNFDSAAYFCSFFKRETGLTPLSYRKGVRDSLFSE